MTNDKLKMTNGVSPSRLLKYFGRLTLFLLIAYCFMLPAFAALDLSEIGVGARPLGMGKAYFAIADDASAIFTNPAGLALNDRLNYTSMSGSMLGDANYLMLGLSDSFLIGKFGLGYVNASVGSIPLTRLIGSGPSLEVERYAQTDYSSSMVFLSYGTKLSRLLRNNAGSGISLGGTLKYYFQGFNGGGDTMKDTVGYGMDLDLGMLWDVNDWTTYGLTFQNVLPTNLGGKFVWKERNGHPEVVESIPMITHLAGRFKLLGPLGLQRLTDQRLDLAIEYEKNNNLNWPDTYHLGFEYWPISMLAIRTGIDQKARATETGTGVDSNYTFGVGTVWEGFTFDYAYHQFGELSENTSHFFSFGYRGIEKIWDKTGKKKEERKKPTIPAPEIVPKPSLEAFSDVPEGHWARKPIQYLATLNIFPGDADKKFRPDKEMTRGEMAVLLIKAKGFTVGKEINVKFRDVPLQSYEAPYISLAVERKYISGFPDGKFQPKKRLTRAETAVIMAKFSGLYMKPKVEAKPFPDVTVKHWAAPAIGADKAAGFFEYLSGKNFLPNAFITRAEAAEVISKTPFAKQQIEQLISGSKFD
ncbi:MAG: S-layer homology domain-containing protein [Candidatus Margulisiibacteriota bacterium]|jgi:hypothetical protein